MAVVVADFDPADFALGAIGFALAVPAELGSAWHRTFTRTIFLAGLPGTVAIRHEPAHVTPGGTLSWPGPAGRKGLKDLSRLLKTFQAPAPMDAADTTVTVAGEPTGRTVEAYLAVGGISVRDYLVHAHHLLAEATLRGLIGAGDVVRLRHRLGLDDPHSRSLLGPALAGTVQTRITHHYADPESLRLYGVLAPARNGG